MDHKVIIKPFGEEEAVNKSRSITGLNKWAQSSSSVAFLMMVVQWLATPLEVFFRKDFGQRWFTPINFYAGMIPIIIFTVIAWLMTIVPNFLESIPILSSSLQEENSSLRARQEYANMILILMIYIGMGAFHLFKIKWRNQANIPMHSFDDGTSRLRKPAFAIAWIFNIFSYPLLAIFYYILLPSKQRKDKPFPKLITNREAFTNTVVEPGWILLLVSVSAFSISGVWLFISAFALLIHAQWKEMARKNKVLDFQDSKIEAGLMRDLKEGLTAAPMVKAIRPPFKRNFKKTPAISPITVHYPNLNVIIEELYGEKKSYLERPNSGSSGFKM